VVVKLLLAALVVAPVVWLVVMTLRGRAQVRSCCAVPADQDGRLADVPMPQDAPREGAAAPTLRA
jgi:hypothetical protein